MTNRVPLMAGNWKMNLDHLEANHLVQGLAMALQDDNHDYTACEVLVLPPFTDIRTVQTIVDADDLDIKYGAQDVSVHDNGAYTGEVSASMLTKLGCTYVVVGHSERVPRRVRCPCGCQGPQDAGHGNDPDHVLRRGPGGPQGRHPR